MQTFGTIVWKECAHCEKRSSKSEKEILRQNSAYIEQDSKHTLKKKLVKSIKADNNKEKRQYLSKSKEKILRRQEYVININLI